PWDQLAIWAVTVGTNMARATPLLGNEGPFGPQLGMTPRYDARALLTAGGVVGAPTLLRFYVLHCLFIPVIASILIILHFRRIRPRRRTRPRRPGTSSACRKCSSTSTPGSPACSCRR